MTALGYWDSSATRRKAVVRSDAVSADGVPRRAQDRHPAGELRRGEAVDAASTTSNRLPRRASSPTARGSTRTRSTTRVSCTAGALTKYRNGDLKFAQKVKLGSGYGSLTSLQASTTNKVRKNVTEYLYATTTGGALKQIAVPFKKPARERVKTLSRTGYERRDRAGVVDVQQRLRRSRSLTRHRPGGGHRHLDHGEEVVRPGPQTRPCVGSCARARNASWDLTAAF